MVTATTKSISPQERTSAHIHGAINHTVVNKDSIEALTRETDKKVTGTFINVETPGQPAKVCGRFYKGMEYFQRVFLDGEKCTIPLSIARFINERCTFEKHSYLVDEKGNPLKVHGYFPRYKFTAEF